MNFGTSEKKGSIMNAWNASCYHEMDFSIPENSTVFEAVERFAAYDIGALVTTDENGKFGLRSSVIRTKSAPNISSSSK
jgi:predicted transcriptional regulator